MRGCADVSNGKLRIDLTDAALTQHYEYKVFTQSPVCSGNPAFSTVDIELPPGSCATASQPEQTLQSHTLTIIFDMSKSDCDAVSHTEAVSVATLVACATVCVMVTLNWLF